jgi:hypothetical protein
MKHVVFALLLLPLFAHSQGVVKWEYCTASFYTGGFNSKVRSTVDFGKKSYGMFHRPQMLKDSLGKTKFKSPVDAMNYLGNQGWECISLSSSKADMLTVNTLVFKRRRKPAPKD